MVQTAHDEIQTAIYAKLAPLGFVDSQLAALGVVGVFDFVSVVQNQPFDYITIGDGREDPNNAFQQRGYDNRLRIHIWSRQRNTQVPSAILARINTLIDQKDLTLSTQHHVSTMYQNAIWVQDPDGLTIHVVAIYEIFSQE